MTTFYKLLDKFDIDPKDHKDFSFGEFTPEDIEVFYAVNVELQTRILRVPFTNGLAGSATTSIFAMFGICREVLKTYKSASYKSKKFILLFLNAYLRPFTSKWHVLGSKGAYEDPVQYKEYRAELEALQTETCKFSVMFEFISEPLFL